MTSFGMGGAGPEPAPTSEFSGQRAADSGTGPAREPDLSAEQTGVAEEIFAEQAGVPSAGVPAPGTSGEEGSGGKTAERFPAPEEAGPEADPPPEAHPSADLAKERDDYRDALQRLQADFENYKKRIAKQQEELRDRAAESLVEKLLPVLDTCELALSHGAGEEVKQLSASLFAVLEKEGLEKIDNAGAPFDPKHHDAVAHEPGDGTQEVAEVMRAGYMWRGRVVRPAMVKVRG